MNIMAKTSEEYEKIISMYERNGVATLFYALNRKMNEMAEMLNKQSLATLDLADAKDKSFERIKAIWESAEKVATAIKTLGENAGITNDEEKDTKTPKYRVITTPESIADNIGQLAGQNNQ